MLSLDLLTDAQQSAITRLFEYDHTLLVAAMGSGKTVITLAAAKEMLDAGAVKHILLVAPLKVAKTVWKQEAAKWQELSNLDIALALGTEKQRQQGLDQNAQITVINFENLPWLFRKAKKKPAFDGLVVDELSKLKKSGGEQFKALRPRLKDFSWRVGLTGTPVSEDWKGLFAQMLVVDGGAALGTRAAAYLERYFIQTDYQGYQHELRPDAAEKIAQKISNIVYLLPDYRAELPPINFQTCFLEMPPEVQDVYTELAESMAVEVGGDVVAAGTAAVLVNKLQQVSNGFLYREGVDDLSGQQISNFRIEAARQIISNLINDGEAVLLAYWYKADYHALTAALDQAGVRWASVERDGVEAAAAAWNGRQVDVLLLHPRSGGHGLNLAQGGAAVVWFSPVWSRDLWEQTNARVWRRGQVRPVTVITLEARGSVDSVVTARVQGKADFDTLFKAHIGAYATV